ncbi:MAG TPA: hypothetical protein VNO86_07645 [Candidatus Binatia bacterium]|nr:hypothetical protein [Candidatus Binatia bacterium]
MELRDRLANLVLFALAAVAWGLVGLVVTTRDPLADPSAGPVGAALVAAASGLTTAPLFWLAVFARHRRIAYRGDWLRALRRGAWVGLVAGLFVVLRLQAAPAVPIVAFVVVMIAIAETALSVER